MSKTLSTTVTCDGTLINGDSCREAVTYPTTFEEIAPLLRWDGWKIEGGIFGGEFCWRDHKGGK